jgi:hypothetical protein
MKRFAQRDRAQIPTYDPQVRPDTLKRAHIPPSAASKHQHIAFDLTKRVQAMPKPDCGDASIGKVNFVSPLNLRGIVDIVSPDSAHRRQLPL